MRLLPVASVDVLTVAIPDVIVAVPSDVVPFVNVTVPVTPEGSVAVKVTVCPGLDGLVEEFKVTVGVALVTVWVVVPVAGLLFVSPP
jgi:hypothetical protein